MDQHTYTLGDNGERRQHAELNGRVVDYSYDDLYRLTEEVVTDPNIGNRTSTWTYDAVGNRLTQNSVVGAASAAITAYVYDANDQLTSETTTGATSTAISYSYDNNGNTLTKFDGTATTTYAYDSRNRLLNLNSGQVTYKYDATGIRMSETSTGLTTHYLVDLNRDYAQVVEESFDLNSFAEMTYTYGDDLISQHRRIDATTTDSHSFHYDGIGSTRQLTDVAGNITDSYTYEAFGEVESQTGITPNNYLFTGEQFDPNLGFYYLRARYYNPGIARFQNMDTYQGRMFEPITLHKYLYANANPVTGIDLSGNVTLSGIAAAAGTLATLSVTTTIAFGTIIDRRDHEYFVETVVCLEHSRCKPDDVFEVLRQFPAPRLTRLGAPIEEDDTSFAIPVGFVEHGVNFETRTVTNFTLASHWLYFGTVTRQVVVESGIVKIRTIGSGINGPFASLNERLAESIWTNVDLNILAEFQ